MAAPIRFLSGRQQQQKIGIEGSTENQKVLEVVGRVGIGTTVFEPDSELDIRGSVSIANTITASTINATNVITTGTGNTFSDLQVSGISTFTGLVDANGGLDVTGHSELDDVNVSGAITATTFTGNLAGTVTTAAQTNITSLGTLTGLDVNGHTELDDVNVSGAITATTFTGTVNTAAQPNITSVGTLTELSVTGITSSSAFADFDYLQAPFGSTVTFTVTVASKDSSHRYNGTGSGNAYLINGVQAPFLTLTPGRTYRFTNDNTGSHPLKFYLEADKTTEYTSGVSFQNTYTEITVGDETPVVLHYQCTAHGYMGNAIQVNSNVVNTNYAATLRDSLTVSGNINANGNIVGDNSTNISGINSVTATSFHGALSGNATSATTATTATNVTVADESSDTTCFPLFVTAATGDLAPKSGSNLTFNSSTGALSATDFNSTSDENLKENIRTIEDPLAKVVQIRGVNFDWKENQKPSVGVIAQEVEKVFPELVANGEKKTVNYNGLIGLLIEVVKEQQTQINSLNERLSKLE